MNYLKLYNNIINNARTRVQSGLLLESHHILPRSLGGVDDFDNVVNLTVREHFLCHWLLFKINPNLETARGLNAFQMAASRSSVFELTQCRKRAILSAQEYISLYNKPVSDCIPSVTVGFVVLRSPQNEYTLVHCNEKESYLQEGYVYCNEGTKTIVNKTTGQHKLVRIDDPITKSVGIDWEFVQFVNNKKVIVVENDTNQQRWLIDEDQPVPVGWTAISTRKYNLNTRKKTNVYCNNPTLQDKTLWCDQIVYRRDKQTNQVVCMSADDPSLKTDKWNGTKKGQFNLKNQITGEIRCVPVNDPLRLDPNWQPLAYKRASYRNKLTDETKMLSQDDPLLQTGEWVSTSKGWSTYRNVETGEKASFGKDDPRYGDPKWESIYKHCNDHVPDITCPYCGKVCKKGKGYKRWHGENCKHKPKSE